MAIDDVVLFSIRAANLVVLMARQPLLALNIVRYLQKQRDEADSTIEEIAYLTVGERLVRLMRRLADKHGIAEESGIRIDLPVDARGHCVVDWFDPVTLLEEVASWLQAYRR